MRMRRKLEFGGDDVWRSAGRSRPADPEDRVGVIRMTQNEPLTGHLQDAKLRHD